MTDWQLVFFGITAFALVVMAVMQVVVALSLLRLGREMSSSLRELQRDVRPLIEKATRMTDDAARLTAMAVAQAERVDRLVTTLSMRVEETADVVQGAIAKPLRQGVTLIAAFRGVMAAIREWQSRQSVTHDEEDPLFVG